MELFEERNGLYVSKHVQTPGNKSPIARVVLSLLPLLLMGGLFLGLSEGKGALDTRPLIIMAGVFLFPNVLALLIRKFGVSGRIIVDQMQGTVTFAPIGGKRTILQISELARITLAPAKKTQDRSTPSASRGGAWMVLGLESSAGKGYRLIIQSDAPRLRMLADELSVLTSVTVSESNCDT